jgi:(1->4)-alpha-D-glucan 1-alpha-D-glucosylmutase
MDPVIKALLEQTAQEIARCQRFPEATYRLQFHAGFTFRDAAQIVPYLHELGISHCYASPYLKARPGSRHGYDITNHQVLNSEIGTEEDYDAFVGALHAHDMGQILDTVPNHMGIVGNENEWWNDILENGPASPYAGFFDIGWHSSPRPELQGKILIPILGDPYGKVLEAQQLRLVYADGAFFLYYFEHRFPIAPCSYELILSQRVEELEQALGAESPDLLEFQSIRTAIRHLPGPSETEPAKVAERNREKEVIKRRLATLTQNSDPVRAFIEQNVALFNGQAGDVASFALLDELLNAQPYRLSFWRVASDEINYRRFFDINELAALSMEREEVFAATHVLILQLVCSQKVNGLRIDHPDGLYDPKQYLQRLQQSYVVACARALFDSRPEYHGREWSEVEGPLMEAVGSGQWAVGSDCGQPTACWPLYVVVEKILGANEPLREDWPTYGTSGYDFLNGLNGLFVEAANAQAFTRLYHGWILDETPFAEVLYRSKFLSLQIAMSSELHMLAYQLDRLAQKNRYSRDFTLHSLRHALREIIACFPVYRSYITDDDMTEADRRYILRAVMRARAKNPALSSAHFQFIRDMLLLKYPESATEEDRVEQRRFVGKFQQVTAPVMAKGLEDTAFYIYNRLLALNEVGGDADRFGIPPAALHRAWQERQARWPWAFSTTTTHDTKRSEGVRARLNVLSELPGEWQDCVARWSRLNQPHQVSVEEIPVPDPNEEYFLYQTLLGAWPIEPYTSEEYAEFVRRLQAYMQKALHEAKVHSSWLNPDPAYDDAMQQFVARILDPEQAGLFLKDFRAFQQRISHYGMFNALAQTLLKITAPGVPDTYQGTELWDFSLVDPDNRRPVDYERRRRLLEELQGRVAKAGPDLRSLAAELLAAKEDGRIKLYVTYRALHARRDQPQLFTTGEYVPLVIEGPQAEHAFGFVRQREADWAVVVVPRLLTRLTGNVQQLPLGRTVWQDTRLMLPDSGARLRWRNVFTGETLTVAEQGGRLMLPLAEVFGTFPVALFLARR